MKMTQQEILMIILGIIIIAISIFAMIEVEENEYKRGTIDALTGKPQYQLVTNPDSTRTWERIKN